MRELSKVNHKVTVFISSNMGGEYNLVRESLRILLLKTGVCEVYLFEDAPGSSEEVKTAYLTEIKRSDLIVFLIRNKDRIGDGTMAEYERSRELNKKCIFLFCTEGCNEETLFQTEIKKNLHGEKYREVSELRHMAEDAYISVLDDIMGTYLDYCEGQPSQVNVTQNSFGVLKDETEGVEAVGVTLGKPIYKGHDYVKEILWSELFDKRDQYEVEQSQFDLIAGDFLKVCIGRLSLQEIECEELHNNIEELHTGNLKKCIEHRLNALEACYSGNLKKAIQELTEALSIAKSTKRIPVWVENDVAIDLRNAAITLNEYQDVLPEHFSGQKEIDESIEPLFCPVTDRAGKTFYEVMLKRVLNDSIAAPFTVHFGQEYHAIRPLVDQFISALLYGSIAHIEQIKKEISYYLELVSLQTKDRAAFISAIRMLLLIGNKKELKNFLEAYGEYTDLINDDDVCDWFNAIHTLGIRHHRLNSEMLALALFGDYLSEEYFQKEYKLIKQQMIRWFENPFASDLISNAFINMLDQQSYRIGESECINFAYTYFDYGYRRWYQQVFKMLSRLDFANVNESQQNCYCDWLISCLTDKNNKNDYQDICQAAQAFRLQTKSNGQLDKIIEEFYPSFYENEYFLNVLGRTSEDFNKQIGILIAAINGHNDSQGVNGCYTGYAYNPYIAIGNIIQMHADVIDMTVIDETLKALLETLRLERQSVEDKISALDLLLVISIHYPFEECVKRTNTIIARNQKRYLTGYESPLSNSMTKNVLEASYWLLRIAYNKTTHSDAILFMSQLSQLTTAETITVMRLINKILYMAVDTGNKVGAYKYFAQYLFEMTGYGYSYLRQLAISSLLFLTKQSSEYQDAVLNRLLEAMNHETYKVKVQILRQIRKMDLNDPKVQFLFSKARVDNHYLVRKEANETNFEL